MAKKTTNHNYRVNVSVDTEFLKPKDPKEWHQDAIARCRAMQDEIKRHCDVDGVEIEWDHNHECEYCGYVWGEDGDNYNGCCAQDEADKRVADLEQLKSTLSMIAALDQDSAVNQDTNLYLLAKEQAQMALSKFD